MQTIINITGQISGNITLHNTICNAYSQTHRGMFNSYTLTFPTRKMAYAALWQAYKVLRSDKQDAAASMLHYSKKSALRYDASIAKVRK